MKLFSLFTLLFTDPPPSFFWGPSAFLLRKRKFGSTSHFPLLCPTLLEGMATFQEENQRGAGMWMERKQRFCEILRREDGSCSRLCDQRNHVNSTAFRRPWIPFLLDSSVWRIRNACLSSDKRLKKAEDV